MRTRPIARLALASLLLAFQPWPAQAQSTASAGQAQATAARVQSIRAQAGMARSELSAQRLRLLDKALPALALARHDELQAEFDRRSAAFERVAAAWQADPSEGRLRELDAIISQQGGAASRASPASGPLPWGAPRTNRRMPAESQAAWYRLLTRDERVHLAQAGLTTVGGVRFSTLPEAGKAPADADLGETAEIRLTPAIQAKAAELGRNPVAIANWVRANIQFTPTWGASQTAEGTLRSVRGNAIDIATLTVALLRAAGIPARYQLGTVDVPAAVAMDWLGGLSRPEAALELLAQGGIAARGISEGGQIRTIRMEHAWATAYVYWSPSRGARQGGAALQPPQHPSPNAALNAWVPIDAAYKPLQHSAGTNLAELAPFNAAAALDAARQGATCTAASAAQVNQAALAAHYGQYKSQAQQQLAVLGADVPVSQVLGASAIAAREQPLLPGTLPFAQVLAEVPLTELPAPLRWRLQLNLLHGTTSVLSTDTTLPELEGQVLSLAFVPESDADAQILAALLRPEAGGDAATGLPSRIAAYLVRVKAQLRANGQLVAEGGSFSLGQSLTLRTLLQNPEGTAAFGETVLPAGETHAWSVQGQAQTPATPNALTQRLASLRSQFDGAQLPAATLQASELLHAVASTYQSSLDAKSRLYQRVANAIEARLPGVARASSRLEVEEAYGLVLNVRPGGVAVQAERLGSAVASRDGAAAAGYGRQSLERASAEAHQLLNRLFGPAGGPAQSAVSGLAFAASQGQTIWRADAQTLGSVLAGVDAASTVRAQLEHAATNGQHALLATNAVDLGGGLPMDPLLLSDPSSGAAAFHATSRAVPVVQVTALRPGLIGWLGLADAQAAKVMVVPAMDAAIGQLNTVTTLLGDIDGMRWQGFAGQSDVLDALYQSRLSEAAGTANACDWLISTLASQLGGGLPAIGAVNRPPVITSQPVTTAQAGAVYTYQVTATDADNDPLTFTLIGTPTGMTVSAAGRIEWPQPATGQFAVTLRVSDGKAIAEQAYTLNVGAAGSLQLQLALSPSIANPGQTVTLQVTASSSAGAASRTATLDGAPLAIDAQGRAIFPAPAAGAHPIVVTASDGVTTTSREVILTVKDPADTAAPGAAIASPVEDAGLRGMVTISGTATDTRFAYYQLLLKRVDAPADAWQEFARGLAPVANGDLGQLDTSLYENGLYQIGLRVVDVNGAQSTAGVTVEFLGNLKLGQFRLSFADVRTDALGLPLMLTRTYDSAKKDVPGDFGWGWSASGQDMTLRKNTTLGVQWEVVAQALQVCLRPAGRRRISITLPDGGLYRFDAKNAVECSFGQAPAVDIQFVAVPGPTGGAAGRVGAGAQLRAVDGALLRAQGGALITEEGATWNPKDFELTTEDGFKYRLQEGVGILNVTDPYGNQVNYGAAGYQHSANLGITFTRDGAGRITKATDPGGRSLVYAYNAAGELESVTDREGKVTRFTYATVPGTATGSSSGNQDLKHLLASITDPRGQVIMSNQFDAYGRLTGTADALGQTASQSFDLGSFRQTVTDRRGNRTVYTFDAEGNITQSINALGQTTTFTFDANGNETSVTNALGETITRSFDPVTGKQLTERNHLGHTTVTSYPTLGMAWQRNNPIATTDARGHTSAYQYDDVKQPGATPKEINEPLGRTTFIGIDKVKGTLLGLSIAGEVTDYSYDALGRKVQETNALGQRTTYAYDANGNEASRTVAKRINGQTVTFTTSRVYDAQNRLVEETDPLGGKRSTSYDAAGKLASQTDSLGRVTRYHYDANARLIRTEYPDGTSETVSYDAEGNETSKTDRQGRVTRMDYDALNRLVKTTHPDGSTDTTEYDPAGRVAATVDRRGWRATFGYDGAGRQTSSTDASGRTTAQTYDENGNRTSVTVDGRTTAFEYDALNRLTKTTWPDGSTHSSVYRPDNRKQSETDARGVTTAYGYDAAGRLTSVAQSLAPGATATTAYGYDETGAKTTQVDALGRTTTWTLDGNGRITSRTIQDGSKESSRYDAEGNRLERVSFAGETITWQYDSSNRVTGQVVPAGSGSNSAVPGSSVIYSYSQSGQVLSQQEQGATSLNGTQSYKYDANDRLTQVSNPIGQISYGLDAAGNITERSTAAGTVRYEYDEAGRMLKVIAPDGKQARYAYDAAGRLERVERDLNAKDSQAQVLVTYHRHDAADRPVAIAQVKRTGNVDVLVAGQALTRTTGGTIARIETYRAGSFDTTTGQFAGTPAKTQTFEYDTNARLTRETRTQAGSTTDTAYEYDAAGNRTKKTVTTVAGNEITIYGHDNADRITQESVSLAAGGNRISTYTWDGNGNLAAKTEAGKVTLYRFDPQNRLIDIRTGASLAEAQAATPKVSYAYDASGNRVRKGGAQASNYLIDSSHTYAQVALETKGADSTAYVRGLQLIRQTKVNGTAGEDLFPLSGHLGTSLGAVDADGNLVEQVDADAFGNLDQATSLKQTRLYTGEYWDQDSQLLYLRARWYDPKIGRFISADPFEGRPTDPRSFNRYAYARNDGVHVVDPSGKFGIISITNSTFVQTSLRGMSFGGAASFVAKTGAEIAFEMATGIPVITSPRSLITAIRSGANVTGNLATKFWLNMFKGGADFEKEGLKFLSKLGYTKNTKRFADGELSTAKSGYFIPDVYVKGDKLLDFKTSFGAVSKEQFQQFIMIANQELGLKVSLVMLKKPTPGEVAIMEKWAKEVSTKTDEKDILFSVIHLLD